MSPHTALPLFISDSATKKRRSAGSKKVIKIAPALTLPILKLTPYSIHSAAIRVSKHSRKKLSPRKRLRPICGNLCHQYTELLRRTEAAQRLQGGDCQRRRGVAAHAS